MSDQNQFSSDTMSWHFSQLILNPELSFLLSVYLYSHCIYVYTYPYVATYFHVSSMHVHTYIVVILFSNKI